MQPLLQFTLQVSASTGQPTINTHSNATHHLLWIWSSCKLALIYSIYTTTIIFILQTKIWKSLMCSQETPLVFSVPVFTNVCNIKKGRNPLALSNPKLYFPNCLMTLATLDCSHILQQSISWRINGFINTTARKAQCSGFHFSFSKMLK